MKRYLNYKDSGVEWLGEIPEHWEVKKLKFVADIQPSNVDKKTFDDEIPILLCNYSDVYKNEWITNKIEFMKATATQEEISKFSIRKGDVIITKDSENPYDIAVPALVIENFENVLCGYHLTQIRTKQLDGNFLFRLFQSKKFNGQFVVHANGVTRFGLPSRAINDAFIGFPPLEEQKQIARFLDRKLEQINHFISNKQRLIKLLKEQKTAIVNGAVTKGLNPHAPMKPSGIEWLGEIPEHWNLRKISHLCQVVRGGSPRPAGDPKFFGGNYCPWITVGEITKDENKFLEFVSEYLTPEGCKYSRYLEQDTLVLTNSGATLGVPKILKISGCINDGSVAFLNLKEGEIAKDYLYYYFRSLTNNYRERIKQGSGQPNLNTDIIKTTPIPLGDLEEQRAIVKHIETESAKIDLAIAKIEKEIELIQEYRTTLISDAVTGKIDIRDTSIIETILTTTAN